MITFVDETQRLHAVSAPWRRGVEFLLVRGNKAAEPPVFVERDSAIECAPTFWLPPESAQQLMDDLWNCGFRPTEGTGSAGALAATQRHLDDMRALVLSPLGLLKK